MKEIFVLTIKSVFRDRVFLIITGSLILYLAVPVFGLLSMKNVFEISVTLSLTLNSFILLMLSILGGVATVWRDMEKKYVYTLLSIPLSREAYILGRFFGFSLIMLFFTLLNFLITLAISSITAKVVSDVTFSALILFIAFFLSYLKFTLLMMICFLFSVVSTSFFLPFFATIAIFLLGNASQGIYDAIFLAKEVDYPEFFKILIKILYFILPNLSTFDFTIYASYGIDLEVKKFFLAVVYFLLYFLIVLSGTLIIFKKKNLQ